MVFFKYLFRPSWWIRNHETCLGLDSKMNNLMDENSPITNKTKDECTFGGMVLWIENHPYASCEVNGVMPRRSTVERFFAYMNFNSGGKL